jgi:hypothetical protein
MIDKNSIYSATEDNVDEVVDYFFDYIDDLLLAGKFSEVDEWMLSLRVDDIDNLSVLVCILCITHMAHTKLAAYKEVSQRVVNRIKVLAPDRWVKLVKGFYGINV